jgi:hypothetical protein
LGFRIRVVYSTYRLHLFSIGIATEGKSMSTLRISITSDNQRNQKIASLLQSIVDYTRIIRTGGTDASGNEIPDDTGPKQRQVTLSESIDTEITVSDYAEKTPISVAITDSKGSVLISFRNKAAELDRESGEWRLEIELSAEAVGRIIAATTPNKPETSAVISAKVEFKPTIEITVNYRKHSLVISPVEKGVLPEEKLIEYFGAEAGDFPSSKIDVAPSKLLSDFNVASVHSVDVSIQGQFEFVLPRLPNDNGWLWVLSGPSSFAGLVSNIGENAVFRRVLWLPFETPKVDVGGEEGEVGTEDIQKPFVPVDPSEQELIESPELFTDDPGTRCKPFSSPNRIVGEKSFHTVLRVSQPEISTDPAAPKSPRPFDISNYYNLDASEFVLAASAETPARGAPASRPVVTERFASVSGAVLAKLSGVRNAITSLVAGTVKEAALTPEAEVVAEERADILRNSEGRRVLSSDKGLDWEDNTPAQSASLAYGHILDYRVRWRNNGYSLGNVLYSLALAPRQTKQIVTVTSEIIDRARRVETTSISEEIEQATTRDYGYSDAVEAGLSEWAKGGSSSKTTGAAGGIGLAIGPVVLGGGASHGRAESSSWKEGGRKVTAFEEQSLRDAIRQHGDSIRQLESVVVQEQTQEETTQAVSETVRNPNYCHSLTVVYHEILRHLRVDTEVVGARECVFVPLPIRPFTWQRMIRWRDSLTSVLRRRHLRWVMPYLEDVETNFASSEIKEGARADQPIKYLKGSIYIRIAIERPQDKEDDTFEVAKWLLLSPFVSRPIREIYDRLRRNKDQMDRIFQQDYAPTIATKWVDQLTVNGGAQTFDNVDMTLASRYSYNRTVRVDFTYVPDRELVRRDIESINVNVKSDAALTPGSIVNVEKIKIRYYTDDFNREKTSIRAADDLINVEDGTTQAAGADLFLELDDWEKKDQRALIKAEALKLRKHLNEHMEYYHKYIWWNMDRDKLYMLLDTIYVVSEDDGRSVASVVEKNPIAILGNSLVYKVAGGAHLRIDGHEDAKELNEYYVDSVGKSEPIRISLPTAGVYAQALLDDCEACEEHFGSTEWILGDKEPELAVLDPSLLSSRRSATPDLKPSELPTSIINLQNAPNVPAPSGFGGVLDTLGKADSFGDMAGLAGTQANARAAMESAAALASTFGTQAAEIRKAEIAAKVAKEKLAVVKKAKDSGALSDDKATEANNKIVEDMATNGPKPEESLNAEEIDKVAETADEKDVDIDVDQKAKKVSIKSNRNKKKFTPKKKSKDADLIDFTDEGKIVKAVTVESQVKDLVEDIDDYLIKLYLNSDNALERFQDTMTLAESVSTDDVQNTLGGLFETILFSAVSESLKLIPQVAVAKVAVSVLIDTNKFLLDELREKGNSAASQSNRLVDWIGSQRTALENVIKLNREDEQNRIMDLFDESIDKQAFSEELFEIGAVYRQIKPPAVGLLESRLYVEWINAHFKLIGVDAPGCLELKVDATSGLELESFRVKAPKGSEIENRLNSLNIHPWDMRIRKRVCILMDSVSGVEKRQCLWLGKNNEVIKPEVPANPKVREKFEGNRGALLNASQLKRFFS